jgi:hypothetical protein
MQGGPDEVCHSHFLVLRNVLIVEIRIEHDGGEGEDECPIP